MENDLNLYLRQCISDRLFPGCVLGIVKNEKNVRIAAGRLSYDPLSPAVTEDTVYDVASITKSIPTACLALKLAEERKLGLSSRLIDFVPEFCGSFREEILISHLLTHALDFEFRLSEKKDLPPRGILAAIFKARLRAKPGTVWCYANATSILLGLAVERAAGMRLDKAADAAFFRPLGMNSTSFFADTLDRRRIAPSENDPWRGRMICGEVHDESAWALRGEIIAGSAGLFSTAPDLLKFLSMLLRGGESDGVRFFMPQTVSLMHTNALAAETGCRAALGWELDQERFMGKRRSPETFGKTGFTGCAIVADPLRRTGFVFLTNHTFPRRRKNADAINAIRCRLSDMILQ